MKIVLAHLLNTKRDRNGVVSHILDLEQELTKQGMIVRRVHPAAHGGTFARILGRVRAMVRNNRILKFLRPWATLCTYYLQMRILFRRGDFSNAVVNAQDPISALAALRSRQGPVVLTCHSPEAPWREFENAGLVGRKGRRLLRAVFVDVLRRPDVHLVCVSRHAARMYGRIARREIARVIYPGIRDCAHPTRHDEPYILNVGTISDRKNQAFLIRIARAARERGKAIPIKLVGAATTLAVNELHNRIREAGVEEQVEYLGPLAREEVTALMTKARLYVHAARRESFGMTIVEAVGAGTPVLALENSALKEILPDHS